MTRERDMGFLWHTLLYEVHKATASLMYLLQGMEAVRASELVPYNELPPVQQQFASNFPKLPYLDVPLSLSGIGFDPNAVLRREGEAEQMAFKGWVEQVYFLWENRFRNELGGALQAKDAIRLEGDPWGDFRFIRNDLIHESGLATEKLSGKSTVLKWFAPGERMVLRMRHVLDFLNQLGFMTSMPGFLNDGASARWIVFPGMVERLAARVAPEIVSIRASFDHQDEDGTSWHIISVVFENGVFVDLPAPYQDDGSPVREQIELLGKTTVDQEGNLRFATGAVKDRESLYWEAVDALFGRGPKIEGLGVPGPAFRFRRDDIQ